MNTTHSTIGDLTKKMKKYLW